jgi:hypothetical protein
MVADRTPFAARIAAFIGVIADASSGPRGCIAMKGLVCTYRDDAISDPSAGGLNLWTLALVVCCRKLATGEILDTSSGETKCRSLVAISPRQTAGLAAAPVKTGLWPRV